MGIASAVCRGQRTEIQFGLCPRQGAFQNHPQKALQRYESIWDARFWMKMMNMTNLLAFGKDEQIVFLILLVVNLGF